MYQNKTSILGSGNSAKNSNKPKIESIKKQIDHIDSKHIQFLNKGSDINWNQILLNDLQHLLELFKASPMNYSFKDINAFIGDIKSYIHPNLTYFEYKYLLRIFCHKVHDDHTAVYFKDSLFMYAGFTATCQIKENIGILRENDQFTTVSSGKSLQKSKQILKKNSGSPNLESRKQDQSNVSKASIKNLLDAGKSLLIKKINKVEELLEQFVVNVDVVNQEYLLGQIQQGDQIILINKEPAIQYLKRVAEYSQRNTNFLQYNLMKQAISLGIQNYLFPVHSITIQRKGKSIKIALQYSLIDYFVNFKLEQSKYNLDGYMKVKLNQVTIFQKMHLFTINKYLLLIIYPNFIWDYKVRLNIIKAQLNVLSKQNKKKGPPNTIIIDLRGNMGGLNYDMISFIDILIQHNMGNYIVSDKFQFSISGEFGQKWLYLKTSTVLNSDNSDLNKKKMLQQIAKEYKEYLQLNKKHKSLIQATFNKVELDIQNLIHIQRQMYLERKIPGIVLITNEACKSGCSMFVSALQLFPHVIVVGSDVQAFNGSGNAQLFQLYSNIGVVNLPTGRAISNMDDVYLKTSDANLYIHNQKIPKEISKYCKWLETNKLYFDSIIQKQCTLSSNN